VPRKTQAPVTPSGDCSNTRHDDQSSIPNSYPTLIPNQADPSAGWTSTKSDAAGNREQKSSQNSQTKAQTALSLSNPMKIDFPGFRIALFESNKEKFGLRQPVKRWLYPSIVVSLAISWVFITKSRSLMNGIGTERIFVLGCSFFWFAVLALVYAIISRIVWLAKALKSRGSSSRG